MSLLLARPARMAPKAASHKTVARSELPSMRRAYRAVACGVSLGVERGADLLDHLIGLYTRSLFRCRDFRPETHFVSVVAGT